MLKNDWRNWLNNSILWNADGGSGGEGSGSSGEEGSGDGSHPSGAGSNGTGSEEPKDKTFTQDQVNSMIAAEKRKNLSSVYKGLGFESEEQAKEFVEKYKKEEEKNKSELVKEKERAQQLETEKQAEQQKAQDLEYKFEAIKEGCSTESAEDVVVLTKAKMSDDKDFAAALKEVKDQYPSMFAHSSSGVGTGSGGTSPRGRSAGGDFAGIGKRLAEKRKSNTASPDEYFK